MVELTLFIVGATPVGVGGGIVWLDLNGPGEVGYGAVEIKCLEMRGPPSEVWGGIVGIGDIYQRGGGGALEPLMINRLLLACCGLLSERCFCF